MEFPAALQRFPRRFKDHQPNAIKTKQKTLFNLSFSLSFSKCVTYLSSCSPQKKKMKIQLVREKEKVVFFFYRVVVATCQRALKNKQTNSRTRMRGSPVLRLFFLFPRATQRRRVVFLFLFALSFFSFSLLPRGRRKKKSTRHASREKKHVFC